MRTIQAAAGEYDWSGFLPTDGGYKHVYVRFKETIPDRCIGKNMTTRLQKYLLFPYLRMLGEPDPQIPIEVDTWEMLCTVCRSK